MATITVHSLPMYNEVNDFLINFLVHLQAKQIYRIPIWQNILKQSDHWRKLECEGCTMNDKMTIWCLTANCLKLITKNWLNYGPHEAPRSSKPITFSVYKCTFVHQSAGRKPEHGNYNLWRLREQLTDCSGESLVTLSGTYQLKVSWSTRNLIAHGVDHSADHFLRERTSSLAKAKLTVSQ